MCPRIIISNKIGKFLNIIMEIKRKNLRRRLVSISFHFKARTLCDATRSLLCLMRFLIKGPHALLDRAFFVSDNFVAYLFNRLQSVSVVITQNQSNSTHALSVRFACFK